MVAAPALILTASSWVISSQNHPTKLTLNSWATEIEIMEVFCFKLLSLWSNLLCSNRKWISGKHLKPSIQTARVYKLLRISKCKKVSILIPVIQFIRFLKLPGLWTALLYWLILHLLGLDENQRIFFTQKMQDTYFVSYSGSCWTSALDMIHQVHLFI